MKIDDQQIMSILYSPVNYTHASHLPEVFRQHELRDDTLLNFWLLHGGKLCDLPDGWHYDDGALSQLLFLWHRIPEAAHLIGGYLLRNQLPAQGARLMSDARLLAFISLPLLHQFTVNQTIDAEDTASCGIAFILGQFPSLPLALRQRLMLHFPAGVLPALLYAPRTLNNINLLRMALTYAHHYY